jgi:hypothetical protein
MCRGLSWPSSAVISLRWLSGESSSWEHSSSVVSPATELCGIQISSDPEDDRDNARCNRLRKLCPWSVNDNFRTSPIVESELRWDNEFPSRMLCTGEVAQALMKSSFSKPELVIGVCKAHYLPSGLNEIVSWFGIHLANQAPKPCDLEKVILSGGKIVACKVCFMLHYSIPGVARSENSLIFSILQSLCSIVNF